MRILQDFIVKGKEVFIGFEVSKRTWKLCARSGGVIINETSMPADNTALLGYLRNKFPECKTRLMYEASYCGFGLQEMLTQNGYECIVTPPHTVTVEKCSKQKNDRVDSRRLAKNLENNDYRSCFIPSKQLREDRQISRTYTQLRKAIVQVKNQIRRQLEFHNLDKYYLPGAWTDKKYVQLEQHLSSIKLSSSLKYSFDVLLTRLNFLRDAKNKTRKALCALAAHERYKEDVRIVKSTPGIGVLTAIRLVFEWGDIRRFKRGKCFASYLGLIPWEFSSGDFERKGHITKQGNGDVRHMLIEAAWVCIKKDPAMLNKYHAVMRNSGSSKKAIVAVARKLALRIRTLLIRREEYLIGVIK